MTITIEDIAAAFDMAYSGDPGALKTAMYRQRLIIELNQIISKITGVQQEADKVAQQFVATLDELNVARKDKQAEIDALENPNAPVKV